MFVLGTDNAFATRPIAQQTEETLANAYCPRSSQAREQEPYAEGEEVSATQCWPASYRTLCDSVRSAIIAPNHSPIR